MSSVQQSEINQILAPCRCVSEVPAAPATVAYIAAETAESHYRVLVEQAADGIIVYDEQGRILDLNHSAATLLGYSRDELVGERFGTGMLAGTRSGAQWEHLRLQPGGCWRGEVELVRRDGEKVPVETTVNCVALPIGLAYQETWRDISERRRLERLRQESSLLITQGLELPLEAIKGFAELLQRSGRVNPNTVASLLEQVGYLGRLTTDLHESTRLETGRLKLRPSETNLAELVRSTVASIWAARPTNPIRLDVPPRAVIGWWDRDRLRQVLQNLFTIAVERSPRGCPIAGRVEARDQEVCVSIRDAGPEIPPDVRPYLFERFHQAYSDKRPGPGNDLALPTARGLVEAHGGRLWCVSGPSGTTLSFSLPYHQEPSSADREHRLTPRQLEIASLVAQGKTNRQIAEKLVLTEGTVGNHIQHIFERLNFHSRAQVAAWVVERGVTNSR